MPRLCFNCGRIVYENDECKEREGNSSQYGVWLGLNQVSSLSALKRNYEPREDDCELMVDGKRLRGSEFLVCDEDRLGVVAAEQHHLVL